MSKLSILVNDNYTVLKVIADNTVTLMGTKYCPLSQTEIAALSNINRVTCGNIINKLKTENLLKNEPKSSKHLCLTDEANKILKILEKID